MKENIANSKEDDSKIKIARLEEKFISLDKQIDRIGKEEKKILYILAAIGTLLLLLLSYFFDDFNSSLRNYEHRITVLEEKINNCCRNDKQIANYGGYEWDIYKGTDYDNNGKVLLSIEIGILSEDYRWNCGSTTEIIRDKKIENFGDVIKNYTNKRHLKNVKEILCIGMASEEGEVQDEQGRASRRMETLINLVENNIINDSIKITGVNIGKFTSSANKECNDKTLDQRRVVLLKVIEKDKNMTPEQLKISLQKILVDKAKNIEKFPFDIRQYSLYPNIELREGRNK